MVDRLLKYLVHSKDLSLVYCGKGDKNNPLDASQTRA